MYSRPMCPKYKEKNITNALLFNKPKNIRLSTSKPLRLNFIFKGNGPTIVRNVHNIWHIFIQNVFLQRTDWSTASSTSKFNAGFVEKVASEAWENTNILCVVLHELYINSYLLYINKKLIMVY